MPGPIELALILVIVIVFVLPFWEICTNAGFPGWISLAMLIPMANFLLPYFLAFSDWPALRDRETMPGP